LRIAHALLLAGQVAVRSAAVQANSMPPG